MEASWRQPESQAKTGYFFDPIKMKVAAAADSDDIDDYPNPDLAVEVDISRPKLDRPEIYAALKVPELWRARDGSVSIEHLGPDGTYVAAVRSRYLPVSPEDVTRWVFAEDKSDVVVWEKRLRAVGPDHRRLTVGRSLIGPVVKTKFPGETAPRPWQVGPAAHPPCPRTHRQFQPTPAPVDGARGAEAPRPSSAAALQ